MSESIEAQAAAKFHAERTVNGCPVCHVDAFSRCVTDDEPEELCGACGRPYDAHTFDEAEACATAPAASAVGDHVHSAEHLFEAHGFHVAYTHALDRTGGTAQAHAAEHAAGRGHGSSLMTRP